MLVAPPQTANTSVITSAVKNPKLKRSRDQPSAAHRCEAQADVQRPRGAYLKLVFPAVGLVGLGGREPVAEGDGKCVQGGLPSHRPSCPAHPGGVERPGDQIEALERACSVGKWPRALTAGR